MILQMYPMTWTVFVLASYLLVPSQCAEFGMKEARRTDTSHDEWDEVPAAGFGELIHMVEGCDSKENGKDGCCGD